MSRMRPTFSQLCLAFSCFSMRKWWQLCRLHVDGVILLDSYRLVPKSKDIFKRVPKAFLAEHTNERYYGDFYLLNKKSDVGKLWQGSLNP